VPHRCYLFVSVQVNLAAQQVGGFVGAASQLEPQSLVPAFAPSLSLRAANQHATQHISQVPWGAAPAMPGGVGLPSQQYPPELAHFLQLQALGRVRGGLPTPSMVAHAAGRPTGGFPSYGVPGVADAYLDPRGSFAAAGMNQHTLAAGMHGLQRFPHGLSGMQAGLPPMAQNIRGMSGGTFGGFPGVYGQNPLFALSQQGRTFPGQGGIPIALPAVLAQPEDSLKLSSHQVLLRHQIEAFQATEDDVSTHTRGRNKPITLGQVGIRCRHCAHLPVARRQKGSTYFPASLLGLYQAAQNMSTTHVQCGLCTEMPEDIKQQFVHLMSSKVVNSGAGRPYWAQSAKNVGLVDTDEGIRFVRDIPPGVRINDGSAAS
jgi:hypothetical protein